MTARYKEPSQARIIAGLILLGVGEALALFMALLALGGWVWLATLSLALHW